jgi:hypothetical protein
MEPGKMRPFIEPEALAVFRRYKASGAVEELDALLRLLIPVAETVICKKLGFLSDDYPEIRAYVLRRMSRGLANCYDPERGSLFNFITKLTENSLVDLLRRKVSRAKYVVPLDDEMLARFSVNGADHRHAAAEIAYRVMQVKTIARDRGEIEAQRWLVRNLLASGFRFYRHEAADAMTVVYNIPPDRSRKLYDITVLSVRRILIGERKLKPVDVGSLLGTKGKALLRYRSRLSELEFAKLVFLMRNLAPSIIETGEFSLEDILYGPPGERALFSHKEALAAASGA